MLPDPDYTDRLVRHLATIVCYEDTSTVVDENRLMLALVFLRNHVDMVAAELGRLTKDGVIEKP